MLGHLVVIQTRKNDGQEPGGTPSHGGGDLHGANNLTSESNVCSEATTAGMTNLWKGLSCVIITR
jgi:hypothetical protein